MIKKLVVSAVVLTILISGKEANAAGAGGFARGLSSAVTSQIGTAQTPLATPAWERGKAVSILTFAKMHELARVNDALNSVVPELDAYFDELAGAPWSANTNAACSDCARLKRDRLLELGWSEKAMEITYAVDRQGRVERVLVIATAEGEVILGNDSPIIALPGEEGGTGRDALPAAAPGYFDI